MIIDFHTHIFPEALAPRTIHALATRASISAYTDGTLRGLLDSMNMAGIDKSVILPVATKPSQFKTINEFAQIINNQHNDRLISFGGIHPDSEDYEGELRKLKSMGFDGIKLHPDYQGVMIDDPRMMRIIECADALDFIIVTHAGEDIGMPEPVHCPPERARRVIDSLHPKRFVLAHYGAWNQWDEVYDCLAGEDVYFDTGFIFDYIDTDLFMKIYEKHAKDKILFATDSPWSDASRSVAAIQNLPISDQEKEDILGNNALKLLQWV